MYVVGTGSLTRDPAKNKVDKVPATVELKKLLTVVTMVNEPVAVGGVVGRMFTFYKFGC